VVSEVAVGAWHALDTLCPSWHGNPHLFFRGAQPGESNVPPAIFSQPQSQTVTAGSGASFNVGASGTPPLSYQWRRDGATMTNSSRVSGAKSATLMISSVQSSDAGSYKLFVTNGFGTASSDEARLTVTTPFISLAEALDGSGLVWDTLDSCPWKGQSQVTHDGVDAAEGDVNTACQGSYVETTVTGPGTLSFWWKVSSVTGGEGLYFNCDYAWLANLSGETDWQQEVWPLSAGTHLLQWLSFFQTAQNRGWLDEVSFVQGGGFGVMAPQPKAVQTKMK
jgi:hypothetical protein